jgi:hypothetical protein
MESRGWVNHYDVLNSITRILLFVPVRVVFLISKNRLSLKAHWLLYIPPLNPTFCPQNAFMCFPKVRLFLCTELTVFFVMEAVFTARHVNI